MLPVIPLGLDPAIILSPSMPLTQLHEYCGAKPPPPVSQPECMHFKEFCQVTISKAQSTWLQKS